MTEPLADVWLLCVSQKPSQRGPVAGAQHTGQVLPEICQQLSSPGGAGPGMVVRPELGRAGMGLGSAEHG